MATMNPRDSSRPLPSQVTLPVWPTTLNSPTRTYLAAATGKPMGASRYNALASTAVTNSSVVTRRPRMNGLRFFYSHGATKQPLHVPYPGGADGRVHQSAFQQYSIGLNDWSTNDEWYAAGYPRNLGLSFKVQQLKTQVTGGPGPGIIAQRPIFTRVQRVKRPTASPRFFDTKSGS